jgi:CheY-like chemotaxis protein
MKSMLLVESPDLAKMFAQIFERLGWIVAICTTRDRAMSQVAGREPYDLILLSYHVPGTNGVQLIKFIRSLEHRKTTAVVLVTGFREVADEAKAAGADEVLIKPVNLSALIWAVNKHVS